MNKPAWEQKITSWSINGLRNLQEVPGYHSRKRDLPGAGRAGRLIIETLTPLSVDPGAISWLRVGSGAWHPSDGATMKDFILRFIREVGGQDLVEYPCCWRLCVWPRRRRSSTPARNLSAGAEA